MKINHKLFKDFKTFCGPYLSSGDVDPVYPVLRAVHDARGYDVEKRIWSTILYFTWYHLGSAEKMQFVPPELFMIKLPPVLPTGIERRGFRGKVGSTKASEFLRNVLEKKDFFGSLEAWMFGAVEGDHYDDTPEQSWIHLFNNIMGLKHCGTWAAYKWCDLAKNVLNFNISAPDIGYGGGGENAGPIPGLVQLTGCDWKECANNISLQRKFYDYCLGEGIEFNGMEQMETALCDFNSLTHGRYYIGHDLDKQMEDLMGLPQVYWDARAQVFPEGFLGEFNGWRGVDKGLCKRYISCGEITRTIS